MANVACASNSKRAIKFAVSFGLIGYFISENEQQTPVD
jgi:hypothetical protein